MAKLVQHHHYMLSPTMASTVTRSTGRSSSTRPSMNAVARRPRPASALCVGEGPLDEQLSPQIAMLLCQASYDVVAVAERDDLAARSDRNIFQAASNEQRVVVTNNIKDLRPFASEWLAQGRIHGGPILLPSSRTSTRSAVPPLVAAIEGVLREHPDGLNGRERWIGPLSSL
jgi:hypothetical protein